MLAVTVTAAAADAASGWVKLKLAVPTLDTAMAAPNRLTTWLIAAVADGLTTADAASGVLSARLPVADASDTAAVVSGTPKDKLADSAAVALALAACKFPDTRYAVPVALACAVAARMTACCN